VLIETTHPLLLARLGDQHDRAAWHEFCHRYGELIRNFARHQDLQPADCDDVLQDVLVALTTAMPGFRYDKSRGRFRSYLKTIALNAIFARRKARRREVAIDDVKSSAPGLAVKNEAIERIWDLQWRQYHLRHAMRQISAEFNEADRAAFTQYAINGLGAEETADALKMSVDQVYQAKSRILKRLSAIIEAQVSEEG
jgi:RNA polymerase sigma-70 factor, ECF subfamily